MFRFITCPPEGRQRIPLNNLTFIRQRQQLVLRFIQCGITFAGAILKTHGKPGRVPQFVDCWRHQTVNFAFRVAVQSLKNMISLRTGGCPSRLSQSLRVVKAIAELGPDPEKLNPIMERLVFIHGLFSTVFSNSFTTFRVRSVVASEGS